MSCTRNHQRKTFRHDLRAVSPAISSMIVTSAVVVMVLVAMVYGDDYLNMRMAENEFSTNKQFMLTTGLQIDDIAWTIGRTQTVRYSCRYADVSFEPQVLEYSIEVNNGSGWETLNFTLQTGTILFNMPTYEYTLGENFHESIFPSNTSFLQEGPSAPVSHVYVMERLPMTSGDFTRIVVVPSIRVLNSTIGSQNYVKLYLPLLEGGSNPRLSQSVTLIGKAITQCIRSDVTQIRFTVAFPRDFEGFDPIFFPFDNDLEDNHYTRTVDLPPGSVVEFYFGKVAVSIGMHI